MLHTSEFYDCSDSETCFLDVNFLFYQEEPLVEESKDRTAITTTTVATKSRQGEELSQVMMELCII